MFPIASWQPPVERLPHVGGLPPPRHEWDYSRDDGGARRHGRGRFSDTQTH
jgi:hypothetical protein